MHADPASLLRQHGLQVTPQRIAVLRAVAGRPHATADQVAEDVRGEIGAISRQAVYDSLRVLTDKGIARRVQPAGSAALYDPRSGDNHHHVICRRCDEAEVIYWGTCPACLAARRQAETGPAPQPNRSNHP